MAEVLGVASGCAGLASLVLQLGENAVQLKKLCNNYKGAPETLRNTAYTIETMQMMLRSIQDDQELHGSCGFDVLNRCIYMCEQGIKRISMMVIKLENTMRKSKWRGKMKTAFDDKEIEQYCVELDRATTHLGLAYQLYSQSQQRHDRALHEDIVLQQIALLPSAIHSHLGASAGSIAAKYAPSTHDFSLDQTTMVFLQKPFPHDGHSTQRNRDAPSYGRQSRSLQRRRWSVQFQPWFVSWSWSISMKQTTDGWDLHYRTAYIVPFDSPLFYFASQGDLSAVRALIEEGLARPNALLAETSRNYTVLEAAVQSQNRELCQYLWERLKKDEHAWKLLHWSADAGPDFTYICRLFFSNADLELEFSDYHSPAALMHLIALHPQTRHHFTEDQLRCITVQFGATWVSVHLWTRRDSSFMDFLQLFGWNELEYDFAFHRFSEGGTWLHELLDSYIHHEWKWAQVQDFVKSLVRAGIDVNAQDYSGRTCLRVMLSEVWSIYANGQELVLVQRALTWWVSVLFEAGVKLDAYGELEANLAGSRYRSKSHKCFQFEREDHRCQVQFGSKPEDWVLSVHRIYTIPVYELRAPPGHWASHHSNNVPQQMCWPPSSYDVPSEYWVLKRNVRLFSPWSGRTQYLQTQLMLDDTCLLIRIWSRRCGTANYQRARSAPSLDRFKKHDELADRLSRRWFDKFFCSSLVHSCDSDYGIGMDFVEDARACFSSDPAESLARISEIVHKNMQGYRRHYEIKLNAEKTLSRLDRGRR